MEKLKIWFKLQILIQFYCSKNKTLTNSAAIREPNPQYHPHNHTPVIKHLHSPTQFFTPTSSISRRRNDAYHHPICPPPACLSPSFAANTLCMRKNRCLLCQSVADFAPTSPLGARPCTSISPVSPHSRPLPALSHCAMLAAVPPSSYAAVMHRKRAIGDKVADESARAAAFSRSNRIKLSQVCSSLLRIKRLKPALSS